MIKIQYRDELGNVEATFDSLESYNNYKDALVKKASEMEEAKLKKQQADEAEQIRKMNENWNELKKMAHDFVSKAKSYGVVPSGVLELIKTAIYDIADDRCLATPIRSEHKDDDDLITLLRNSITDKEPTDLTDRPARPEPEVSEPIYFN